MWQVEKFVSLSVTKTHVDYMQKYCGRHVQVLFILDI